MSAGHTQGRLAAASSSPSFEALQYQDGSWVFQYTNRDDGLHFKAEDVQRLAACWNACEGISTDTLEKIPRPFGDFLSKPFVLKARRGWYEFDELHEVEQQRDQMLAALESVERTLEVGFSPQSILADGSEVRTAIQAAIMAASKKGQP